MLLSGLCATPPAIAQQATGTAPGTVVTNTAEVRWTVAGTLDSVRSNTDRLVVAERLDVRLTGGVVVPSGSTALGVDLVNAGNGEEVFVLVAAAPDDPARPLTMVVDVDGDGRCDAAIDRALEGGATPPLAAGARLRLLVCDAPAAVRVTARAETGSGAPGTIFAGRGDGGGDAVAGPTGAAASILLGDGGGTGAPGTPPTFLKSQTVTAVDGSARAAAGSVITYTLAAHFDVAAADAEIEDPLPAGTSLVPGSLSLDGVPLSADADADAGELAGGAIRVRLGDVAAGGDRRVIFAVTVNP